MSSFSPSSIIPPSSNSVLLVHWVTILSSIAHSHTVLVGLLIQVPTHPWPRLSCGPSLANLMLSSKNLKVKQMTQKLNIVAAGSYYRSYSEEPVHMVVYLYAQG